MSEPKHFPIPPCWCYKYGETPKIVQTEADLEAAEAEGWVDHPVDFPPVPEVIHPAPDAPKPKRKR